MAATQEATAVHGRRLLTPLLFDSHKLSPTACTACTWHPIGDMASELTRRRQRLSAVRKARSLPALSHLLAHKRSHNDGGNVHAIPPHKGLHKGGEVKFIVRARRLHEGGAGRAARGTKAGRAGQGLAHSGLLLLACSQAIRSRIQRAGAKRQGDAAF